MAQANNSAPILSFGPFSVDLRSGELRKNGTRIRLQEKPLRVLALLANRQGEMVGREELKKDLWPNHTFIDFETGLNTAVKKLRSALSDDADHPSYVETIPRRGYRFLVPVQYSYTSNGAAVAEPPHPPAQVPPEGSQEERHTVPLERPEPASPFTVAQTKPFLRMPPWKWLLAVAGAIALCGLALSFWLIRSKAVLSFHARDTVLVCDFENQTGDPRLDQALQTALEISLEQSRYTGIYPRSRMGGVLRRMGRSDNEKINASLGMEICQREGVRGMLIPGISRAGQHFILTAQLIDPATGNTVSSYSERTDSEDHLLEAMDRISAEVRRDLGESLYQILQADQLLARVTTPSLQALKDYTSGEQLWRATKYDQGLAKYQSALTVDPDFAMANAAIGHAYYSFVYNNRAQGETYYKKALAASSRVSERERAIIQTHYAEDMGEVHEASNGYERYLLDYPDDWEMRVGYARLLRMHGQPAQAIEQDKEILRLAPNEAHTYVDMAVAYHWLDLLPQSLQAYSAAFQLDPQMRQVANINREYGFTLVQSGQVAQAEQLFSSLLTDPRLREVGLRSLGLLDLYRGQYNNARKHLEEALQYDSPATATLAFSRVTYLLSEIAYGQDRKKDQLAQLDMIMTVFPILETKVEYGAMVGEAYARAGEIAKAEEILNRIAPLVKERSQEQAAYLRVLRAEIACAKGNTTEALQAMDPPGVEDSNPTKSFILDTVARTYQKAGETQQAIAWYEKLVRSSTSSIGWEPQQQWFEDHYSLAQLYETNGQAGKAVGTLDELLTLWKDADPNLPLKQKAVQLRSSVPSH